jgi:hypothetical protein
MFVSDPSYRIKQTGLFKFEMLAFYYENPIEYDYSTRVEILNFRHLVIPND